MSYGEFIATVRERGEYPVDEAERIVEAVLATLGERLPEVSAQHLADQLPDGVADIVENVSGAEGGAGRSWGVEEFISQVAETADEDEETAETDTRVVFSAIADQVSGGEMNKLLSQLPTGYAELFGYSELA
ncbi:DUF2267 domain-containing protein [Streptomyces hoynatensis]|uniref:DUF2267 domain-containing protein n=1 Tax=Streptomyces hoynatensis TaxID=1141874 RepID=A0A3A9YLG5_9ACTN|nr:DUF2267 domain-containing protein [Streptomyces hoynatensis]RKN37080.1 DUF2267 domain-containing protein [Streptomyces hoynatensis]